MSSYTHALSTCSAEKRGDRKRKGHWNDARESSRVSDEQRERLEARQEHEAELESNHAAHGETDQVKAALVPAQMFHEFKHVARKALRPSLSQ